jgi:putative transposase
MCESFFATLQCQLIDRRRFRSHSEARMAVFFRPSNTKGNMIA